MHQLVCEVCQCDKIQKKALGNAATVGVSGVVFYATIEWK